MNRGGLVVHAIDIGPKSLNPYFEIFGKWKMNITDSY